MRSFLKVNKKSEEGSAPASPTTSIATPVKYTSALVKGTSPAGYKQINQYVVIKTIGKGVHGKVYMGKAPSASDNLFVAIKVIPKNKKGNFQNDNNYLTLIKKEIAIMKKLNHPNVVRLLEVIEDPFDENVYLVMEYCHGHIKWRKKYPESNNSHEQPIASDFDSIFKSTSFSISDSSEDEDFSINSPVLWSDQNEPLDGVAPHRDLEQLDKQSSSQFYIGDDSDSDSSNDKVDNEEEEDLYYPVISEDQARYIIKQVISGLDYLHYQGVIHRDIKPANLLYTFNNISGSQRELIVKITDFGVSHFSKLENDPELEKTVGSPAFFAPELCVASNESHLPIKYDNEPHPLIDDPSYKVYVTKSIDIWALGVTLYCMIYGHVPFTAANEYELLDVIPKKELILPDGPSEDCKDLLVKLLEKRWDRRITLDHMKHHKWITSTMTSEEVEQWISDTNPQQYDVINVTDFEVDNAVTIMDKFKKNIRRLSSSFSNMVVDLRKVMSRRGSMTELHHRSPHPSEPRLSTSLSTRGLEKDSGRIMETLPSEETTSSINMSMESLPKEIDLETVEEKADT
eukprot:NODE_12_length_45166_cov_0.552511.p5 type:complete len:571 gc:universal NODE_12_length_45166_cov_0.552511:20396-18684(-)